MMPLRVHADLSLTIDGQNARLSGTGRQLTLELQDARTLKQLLNVALPQLPFGSKAKPTHPLKALPSLLAGQGITLNIRDRRGALLILGHDAQGKRLTLPFVGSFEDSQLASRGALLRMALA